MLYIDVFKYFVLRICFLISISNNLLAQDSSKKISNFYRDVFVDIYYSYDFSKPANGEKAAFLFNHNRHNEVNINLVLASLSYRDSTKRASVGLMAGTYPQINLAAEPELLRHVFEANVGFKISKRKEIWLDAGIMPSHIGFESAVSKDCWTLTRSLLAENSPYYEAGVKASYRTPDLKWYMAVLFLNGWQRIKRINGNNTPAFGTQITFTPTENLSINSSTFVGNDKPDSLRKFRYFHNFYSILQVSNRLWLTTGFDIGAEQKTKGSSQINIWYAPVVIMRYSTPDKFTFAARAEYYRDRNSVIIATGSLNGFQTFGYSANVDYAVQKKTVLRIEARTLSSRDKIFQRGNAISSNATWITASLASTF